MKIGILAFQGDFRLHQKILDEINISNVLVKDLVDLKQIDALIIPGGESTVISKMINQYGFFDKLIEFAKTKSVYGTCAGAIIMSKKVNDDRVKPLGLIDVTSIRNAWGRQVDSFAASISLDFDLEEPFEATFIRAPKFTSIDKKNHLLSYYKKNVVLLRNTKHLISSFHPEIGSDCRIHKYFINMINES